MQTCFHTVSIRFSRITKLYVESEEYVEDQCFLWGKMKLNNSEDVLRGVTLQVYRYVLKNDKPTGIREVQNSLKPQQS